MKRITFLACILATALCASQAFANQTIAIVSDLGTNQLLRFDAETGQYLGSFGGGFFSSGPAGMTIASDGQLYVGDLGSNGIMRFDPLTGQYKGSIGAGMATGVYGLAADSNGNIYASSGTTIYRYQANTGHYEGQVGTGFANYSALVVSGDGALYAAGSGSIFRFDANSGLYEGQLGTGLVGAYSLSMDPSNFLYAASAAGTSMVRLDATRGLYGGSFGSGMLSLATGSVFDGTSDTILVSDFDAGMIRRYSGSDGTYLNSFGLGNPSQPYGIVVYAVPEPAGLSLIALGALGLVFKGKKAKSV